MRRLLLALALLWAAPAEAAVVWSASDHGASISGGGTLTTTATATTDEMGRATVSFSSGKLYFEFTDNDATNVLGGWSNATESTAHILGLTATNSIGIRGSNGILFSGANANDGTFTAGDRIAIAFDIGNMILWWKDITTASAWHPSGDPNLGTGGWTSANDPGFTSANFPGPYFPAYSFSLNASSVTADFTPASFTGAIPTGFQAVDPSASARALLGVGQ
jgi:hypothetical protein